MKQLKAKKITLNRIKAWKPEGNLIYQGPNWQTRAYSAQLMLTAINKVMVTFTNYSETYPNGRVAAALINPGSDLYDNLVRISETIKNGNWNDPTI